ncbi:hypothetical protein PUN28_000841 [Cardiocondyla obscurior]|uniref:Uncharacterized protein n=1 Tax=Cardiocondyla obscurior TaxID=286306 RepID=A0AAW2H1S1_9HYME
MRFAIATCSLLLYLHGVYLAVNDAGPSVHVPAMENGEREKERGEEKRAHRKLGLRSHDKFMSRCARLRPWIEGDDKD